MTPTSKIVSALDTIREHNAEVISSLAEEMDAVINNGDMAETLCVIPGAVGVEEAIDKRDRMLEDPSKWVRERACEMYGGEIPVTGDTAGMESIRISWPPAPDLLESVATAIRNNKGASYAEQSIAALQSIRAHHVNAWANKTNQERK